MENENKEIPSTGELSKYKARLNVYGEEQVQQEVLYEETYAPVVERATIQHLMTIANNKHLTYKTTNHGSNSTS
jgi:hypothetical protein